MFTQIVGNADSKARLSRLIATDSLAHAYLIEGRAGSGKRTLVTAVLTALAARTEPAEVAEKIAAGYCPDVHILAPEADRVQITVGQVRTLLTELSVVPNDLPFHAAVIVGADSMNANAQNALLKQLEEPSGNVYFFLLAENATSLLPTIRSRVQLIRMERIGEAEMSAWLTANLRAARTKTPEELSAVILRADGNLGVAISLLSAKDGTDKHREMVEALFALYTARKYTDLYLQICKLSAKKREDLAACLRMMAFGFRDLLSVKRGASVPLLFLDDRNALTSAVSRLTAKRLMQGYSAVDTALRTCLANGNLALLTTRLANALSGIDK